MLAGDEFGIKPCGLGARDTLRLEAGLLLYGNDISEDTTPLEAGLEWLVKWDKKNFIGKEALIKQKKSGITRKLYGMVLKDPKRIPRKGHEIVNNENQKVGEVTSGGYSVIRECGIALGYLPVELIENGEMIYLRIRDKLHAAEIVRPPFHKKRNL
jgi:aminomethyltransferase